MKNHKVCKKNYNSKKRENFFFFIYSLSFRIKQGFRGNVSKIYYNVCIILKVIKNFEKLRTLEKSDF